MKHALRSGTLGLRVFELRGERAFAKFYISHLPLILVLTLLTTLTTGQQSATGSLKRELAAAKNDTMRLVLLTQLSDIYRFVKCDSALFFAQQELQLAQTLGCKLQQAYAINSVAVELSAFGDNANAYQMILKAAKIAEDTRSEESMLPSTYQDLIFYYSPLFFNRDRFSARKVRREILFDSRFQKVWMEGFNEKNKQYLIEMAAALSDSFLMSNYYGVLGCYYYLGYDQLDSGFVYIQKAHDLQLNTTGRRSVFLKGYDCMGFATYYLKKGEYALAFDFVRRSIQHQNDYPNPMLLMMDYSMLSELYRRTSAIDSSLFYAKMAYEIARQMNSPADMLQKSSTLVDLYRLKYNYNKDSLIKYLDSSLAIDDTLNRGGKVYNFAGLVFDEQMHEREMEAAKAELKYQLKLDVLITGLIALSIIAFILMRNNVQRKKTNNLLQSQKAEIEIQKGRVENTLSELKSTQIQLVQSLQHQASELKMQALRAQMNPHFIFNSLNSIQHLISIREKEEAINYLSKFSKLIRRILENSRENAVSLANEIELLELYMQVEQLRFNNKFDYHIAVGDDIDKENTEIPPLLIQPYVENAILHGLVNKKGKGDLWFSIERKDGSLICKIEDNGVGRAKSGEIEEKKAEKHKSLGIKVTSERISTLAALLDRKMEVIIEDLFGTSQSSQGGLQPAGTRVTISIPVKEEE